VAALSGAPVPGFEEIVEQATRFLARDAGGSLRAAINATGVVLHTNLGRAPLSARATAAVQEISQRYSNLEFDLETGHRGSRHDHGRALIRRVTGAEDAMVVNNNAAALFFVLQALAAPGGVIVSRGQAVEIGGGFRIPDVVAQSGARIVEVGTTNRTYARDYAAAIDASTGAILRVHASNFRIVGFTTAPSTGELAALAKEHGILLIDDLGSGALIPTEQFGLAHEPTVQESLRAGADLVLFSGDKLLGGPQCGVIAGRADLIERLRRHPLARVLRVDKLTFAALSATLLAYADGTAIEEIPIWRMLSADPASIAARAGTWVSAAGSGEVIAARTMVGGGSLPEEGVPTSVAAIAATDADAMAAALRAQPTPVIARIEDGRVLLDPRTVDPVDDETVVEAIRSATA
jgi:L-seryl-tRNA(Ser) seleniumtransferase